MNVTGLSSLIANTSPVAGVIISVALMLFSGFAMTRLTKLARLPNVTGYILAGILIGPYVLNLVPQRIIDGTDFLSDIALAFIAFSTGEFFKLSVLKKSGMKVVWITIFEAVLASVFVFILTFLVLRLELAFSIVLSALASATAPASTMMTIRQTGAKGDFVDTLLQVVALDDVVGLVLYSIAISVALASLSGASGFSFETLGKPVLLNLLVLALGSAFGLFMKLLMPQKRSKDNKLIISVALLFAFCGVCALLDISPLLGCMMMGTVYTNIADDDKLFKQLNYFSPPILLLFFVRSGMSFQLDALVSSSGDLNGVPLLVIGVSYFLVRILGKYAGAWLGCRLVKKDKLVRNYLGLALIPQAGVAIGLAALGARTLGGTMGSDLQTIILASSVLYELIGPGCAKLALYLSRSYSTRLEDVAAVEEVTETGERKSDVQLLIERIQKIQSELPALDNDISEEEAAGGAAGPDAGAAQIFLSQEVTAYENRLDRGTSRPVERGAGARLDSSPAGAQHGAGRHHRLRTFEQAALGRSSHVHSREPRGHSHDAHRSVSHGASAGHDPGFVGGCRHRHHDDQRQFHPLQLQEPDQGPDDLRRPLVLRHRGAGARRGTVYAGAGAVSRAAVQYVGPSGARNTSEGPLEPF